MLGLARRTKAKILQSSTSEVYGDPNVHPQPESYWGNVNPIGLRSCYDEGKRCAETLFFDYHRIHNVRIKVIRIFNTYGPRMAVSDGRVVSNFVVQALRGEDLTIYGDGQQTRSFQYVSDLIDGMLRVMATGDDFTGPVNLGNPGEFTMLELAEKVIKKVGGKSKTSITIESVTPIQVDVEGWHDDANKPKGYRRTILKPDVYQSKYRRQDVKPMLPDKLHHIKNLSIDAPSY